ncbi:MAG: GHKL domain-containing protein [Ruminococcus sp.]|nr:GHKL domain-containing protein [Ruminococcus sp.]
MLQNIDPDKMNRLMKENEDANQIISQLLANHHTMISTIAHEIRNPLTLISSSLQIMELKNPEVLSIVGWPQLTEDVNYLRKLLEELSAFNNGKSLNISTFSMETFLKNITLSFEISLESENSKIDFTWHIPDTLGTCQGDRIKLEAVLLNLLRNAHEAIGNNGRIRLLADCTDTAFIITVQDNGCGIEQENLKSIFEPFVTFKSAGTGLGLAISKRIIEAHNGSLTVESVPEIGSTFIICLPF